MFHLILADAITTTKDLLSLLGAAATFAGVVFTIWWALRRRAEAKRKQERDADVELSKKFVLLESQVDHLQTTTDSIERQYAEFRDHVLHDQKELVKQTDALRTQCGYHQQASDVAALKQETERVKNQLDKLDQEFSHHRDMVVTKYLTQASYQNDLIMWTKTFDDLRQSLRDVHLTLNKRGR